MAATKRSIRFTNSNDESQTIIPIVFFEIMRNLYSNIIIQNEYGPKDCSIIFSRTSWKFYSDFAFTYSINTSIKYEPTNNS